MKSDILAGLNPNQREAVLYFESPLLIIAGAGSGKTKVITHKIAYLIEVRKYSPVNLLGVTFTNKAANEMKERAGALTGIDSRKLQISTFHALGLKILRESGHILGFDAEWQVIDDLEQRKIIERIIKEKFNHYTRDKADNLIKKINGSKMNLLYANNPDFLMQKGFCSDEVKIYSQYHEYQKKNKFWDYEDLVSLPVKLLETYQDVRKRYADRFKYMLVDEFQDTNPNQYQLIKAVAGEHKNITVVGDDDQAIYSWRGASMRFLFDFEHDFPATHIIKLEQNHRSTQQVLDFANNLIKNNTLRRPKSMWTKKTGRPVFIFHTRSKEDEAEKAAELILALKQTNPEIFPLAILYRINSQSLTFETEFLKRNIDFKILKGQPFFERKEIKDSLALLKLAFNLNDNASFLRMIDFLPLGIGARTLESLNEISAQEGLSLFLALKEGMPDKFKANKIFAKILAFNQGAKEYLFSEILDTLLKESGYIESLENRKEDDRLLNIQELSEFIKKWEAGNPAASFSLLLDRISLDTETGAKQNKDATSVYMLTMHNAKGLEFPTVFVAGVNSSYLPFFMRNEVEEIEEERRLFYVASTRASKQLIVSTGSQKPSTFLSNVGTPFYTTVYSVEAVIDHLTPLSKRIEENEDLEHFGTLGQVVEERFVQHRVFGRGKIIKVIDDHKYVVHFLDKGEKIIDTSIVPVEFL